MMHGICAVCGSDDVCEYSTLESVRYKGSVLAVPMAWSECRGCEREFVAAEQIRANDTAVVAAKRESDGLLTPSAVRQARKVLDLSQEAAARLFGGGRNAFSKYERGEVAQSIAMDRLIRLCLNHPELLEELSALVDGKRPMGSIQIES